MKKLILMVAMFGIVGTTSVKANETQSTSELTRTTVMCKNGTFEGFRNNTNHVVNYEFIGLVDKGGIGVLTTKTTRLLPCSTQTTNKRLTFSY